MIPRDSYGFGGGYGDGGGCGDYGGDGDGGGGYGGPGEIVETTATATASVPKVTRNERAIS